MPKEGQPEYGAIRPLTNVINAAAAESEDLAAEATEVDEECGPCGEGIESKNREGRRSG